VGDGEVGHGAPPRWKLVAAFGAIYLIWGSTYLAIRFAIETLPPFLMAGARFLVAGGLMMLWVRGSGAAPPTRAQWRAAAIVGTLLLVAGNGGVVWAQQRVPSGMAALLVSLVPLWIVLLDWLRRGGVRPEGAVFFGVLAGLGGVAWLVGPEQALGAERLDPVGAAVLVFACLSWATGSLYSRGAELPASPALGIGMQMLIAGGILTLLGTLRGELVGIDLGQASLRSWLALGYLVVFGSIVGFSAYVWLLRVADTAKVATYAYVNPVIAILLGWGLAGEELTLRALSASAVIVAAVALITVKRRPSGSGSGPALAVPRPSVGKRFQPSRGGSGGSRDAQSPARGWKRS
jgi:drug/metabolite transporter (DMT)-like permease